MKSKIIFIILVALLLNTGCVDRNVVNSNVINKGKDVWLNHGNELKQIIPICDELFLSKCNVYYIHTSPTTDLYAQGAWIDDLYYEGCIIKPSKTQIDKVNSLLPRPKINDIYYLKDVFTSFGLSYLSKENDALLLVYIKDLDKFNKIYHLKKYNQKDDDKITNAWIKALDDHWYVCSANLIHDGSDKICKILNQ
jgi:hypothetical protein